MPIFDQGYQHWSGELSGHAWRWLAITRHGVRVGMKNRMVRLLLLISWLPAIGLAFVLCLWGLLERKSDLVTTACAHVDFVSRSGRSWPTRATTASRSGRCATTISF